MREASYQLRGIPLCEEAMRLSTWHRRGFSRVDLCVLLVIGLLTGLILLPELAHGRQHARQAEAKTNLRMLYQEEKSYYQDKGTWTTLISLVGFEPERGNRYTYYLGDGPCELRNLAVPTPDTKPPSFVCVGADLYKLGPHSGLTDQMPYKLRPTIRETGAISYFAAVAVGNIDSDPDLDEWSVSALTRDSGTASSAFETCRSGEDPAGTPCHDVDDVE